MSSLVSISPRACFHLVGPQLELHHRLLPFIKVVDGALRDGRALADGVGRAAREHPQLAPYFDIDPSTVAETFRLRRELLFPERNPDFTMLEFRSECGRGAVELDDEVELPDLALLLALCGAGRHTEAELRARVEDRLPGLLDGFLEMGVARAEVPEPGGLLPDLPGLYRLQHAGLLIASKTTRILVDPHFYSRFGTTPVARSITLRDLPGPIDAILLSHSHHDHYDYTSLMLFPRDTPIVVPRVPRCSLLCEDLRARLESLGFENVLDPAWYAPPIRIGDVEIAALPFYGEQPLLRDALPEDDLRNWGNTYVVRTPELSCFILIDSGNDAKGRAREVAEHVRTTYGGVDFVLSNLGRFQIRIPGYITGGSYWLSLPAPILARFASMTADCITLGPEGAAEVCLVAGARYFLPYAHWWGEVGGIGVMEATLLDDLAQALRELGAPTSIVPWTIGDGCSLVRGEAVRREPAATG